MLIATLRNTIRIMPTELCLTVDQHTIPCRIWGPHCRLGEGPLWHSAHQRLYWVDIHGQALHWLCQRTQQPGSQPMPSRLCWVAATPAEYLLAGFDDGIYRLEPQSGQRQFIIAPDEDVDHNRLNDAKVDSHGCLWFGSMDDQEQRASGHLYRYHKQRLVIAI